MVPTGRESATVAANVRAEMARRRLTSLDLTEALGASRPAVSRRLRGDVPFDVQELILIAKWLQIDPTRLLAGTEDQQVAS